MSKVEQSVSAISREDLCWTPEQSRVLNEWNATKMDYPREACAHHLFEEQVRRVPENIAASFEDQHLTYAELNERANQLATYLSSLGVGPEVLVGICLERSLDMLIALLGTLKAGGAYVPLDPAYPKDRISFVLEDSQVKVLLTQDRLTTHLPQTTARVVCLDKDWPAILLAVASQTPVDVRSGNLAYVLYTSGSTGKPKGVQIEHRNLVNFLCTMLRCPGMNEHDVLLAVTTISFDIAGLEMYLPLTAGARVVIASRQTTTDGMQLMSTLNRCGGTMMQATPATWRLLLDAGWEGNPRLKILCGGEALPRDLAQQLLPRCASLWNMYGPTETTIWSSIYRVEGECGPLPPIGRPIGNTQMYILDAERKPVAVDVEGELYIGGDGLARGYLKRPELTAERFVLDPFATAPGARMYRTGDLARFLPDGNIIFLGRTDHQIKIRGFRIELGEIEAALAQHSAIRQCVVVAQEHSSGEKRLIAYLVAREGALPPARQLKEFLRQTLPDYMLPAGYVSLSTLPLTPNGKVDRRALPPPSADDVTVDDDYVAPRSPTEARLAKLWEETLGIRPIGVTTNFFELGASSLAAARLFTRISREFKKDIPLSLLYEAPTIECLAQDLQSGEHVERWRSLVAIRPQGNKSPLFCVHGGGGGVLFTRNLVRHLNPDQPFYGLQSEAVHGYRLSNRQIEEMAARYISEILSIQPRGPYFLAGYCFGGIVAFEMACQLEAKGQRVALVALFNAANPSAHFGDSPFADEEEIVAAAESEHEVRTQAAGPVVKGWGLHRSELARLPLYRKPGYLLRAFADAIRWRTEKYRERLRPLRQMRDRMIQSACLLYANLGGRVPQAFRRHYALAVTHWAETQYVPRVYRGEITIFSGDGLYNDPSAGWQGMASGGLSVCVIPGHHRSPAKILREPSVKILAQELNRQIAGAEGEMTSGMSLSG